jgi:hypothetical protein
LTNFLLSRQKDYLDACQKHQSRVAIQAATALCVNRLSRVLWLFCSHIICRI